MALARQPEVMTLTGRLVLVLEDDPGVREAVERLLVAAGAQTVSVPGGEQGLERLALGLQPDVLLSDVRMPGMGGLGFYEVLTERFPALASRLVFMTGDPGSAQAVLGLVRSGRPLILKPFQPEELTSLLAVAAGVAGHPVDQERLAAVPDHLLGD